MTALEALERVAGRRGWRLRWKAEPLVAYPTLTCTELDILVGGKVINVSGPVAVITGGEATPRETIARMVLGALPRRSPPAVASIGGRA